MEAETGTQLAIRELESVYVPLVALRAALTCASDEQTRFYLNGVYVHATENESRVVATDGHRMFVYSTALPMRAGSVLPVPAWLSQGVILPREGLKERLALLDKVSSGDVHLAHQIGAPHVLMSDVAQSCIFKLRPVDGSFAAYQQVLNQLKVFESRTSEDMASIRYDAGYLKGVGDLAKLLKSDSVRVFGIDGGDVGEPTLVTFPGCAEALLVLMPMRTSGGAERLGAGAARALSGAVAGTVGALRAHRTRWANVLADDNASKRAKAEAQAKVNDYDRRIGLLVTNAAEPALPPPPDPYDIWFDAVQAVLIEKGEGERLQTTDEHFFYQLRQGFREDLTPEQMVEELLKPVSYALADAVGPAPEEPTSVTEPDLAVYRRKLKKGERAKALARFCADLNAVLSAESGGLTLSQLADGVPVDDWFEAGLTPEEASVRCLDWRRIGTVLPPEEVLPGEENKPIGLLQSPARAKPAAPEAEAEAEAEAVVEMPANEYRKAVLTAVAELYPGGGWSKTAVRKMIDQLLRQTGERPSPEAAAKLLLGQGSDDEAAAEAAE